MHDGILQIRTADTVYLHKQNVRTNQIAVYSQDKSVWTSSERNIEFHKEVIIFVFPCGTHDWSTFTETFN